MDQAMSDFVTRAPFLAGVIAVVWMFLKANKEAISGMREIADGCKTTIDRNTDAFNTNTSALGRQAEIAARLEHVATTLEDRLDEFIPPRRKQQQE